MSTEDFDTMAPDDEELFAGLHRSVAGATLPTSTADVVALGRRTRTRHRAVAAGIGTSAAAIVAAIGVLAPSAGTGSGTGAAPNAAVVPNAVSTTATGTASGGAQTLDIQEAGFSVQEQADGTVHLTLKVITDPAGLQSVLSTAGIPAVVQVEQVPEGWNLSRGIQCTPDPGVRDAGAVGAAVLGDRPSKLPIPLDIVIKKSAIPAGDFVTMTQFQSHGRQETTDFGVKTGKQTTCVPRYVYAADGRPVVR
ncbi:hypothetical protein Caci_8763 [Catenulispora acidiphila DSM 44928]|uniref:Uncharacterized protein n=1 Tax=Catenulispora acidiphila (strain DSM 44928 / JCM 14897 / NBRC 102108 / NRRL B-24433 / ID139908) TaxID=479433 RepID=C7Q241_CATAD|nr:hypothetical protein [Catenulispora acidiphila]ACU77578.1 hypothetical protein Caci_8763 [Catenulispora acidiphila DSM 44928]